MRKTMIIPTYWCRRTGELWREGDAVYDHPTPVDQEGTLERTLLSMKQFHEKDFKLVILICPTTPEVEEEAYGQVLRITRRAQLNAETYLFTAGDLREMTGVLRTAGLNDQGAKLLSMFGYAGNCEQAESGKHPSASIFQDTVLENQYNRVHPIQRAICWGFIMAENLSDQRTAPSSQKE